MLWIESVPSLRCQTKKITATARAKKTVLTTYGIPAPLCRPSAAIVPNTATIRTANQYTSAR